MNWSDALRGALSFFLVVTGVGIVYMCLRLGGVFGRVTRSVRQVTDELVPILTRAQTTVDGINLELSRVDEILVTAVHATKATERTVDSVSKAVTTPAKRISTFAASAQEAIGTLMARRAARSNGGTHASAYEPPAPPAPASAPAPGRGRVKGPSVSQIAWAMPPERRRSSATT